MGRPAGGGDKDTDVFKMTRLAPRNHRLFRHMVRVECLSAATDSRVMSLRTGDWRWVPRLTNSLFLLCWFFVSPRLK